MVAAGVVTTGVVTTGVVAAGVVVVGDVVSGVEAAGVVVDGIGGMSLFVESDGFSEIIVVTSVAPVVVTIPEVTIPPGGEKGGVSSIMVTSVKSPLTVVTSGPAVTGAAAVVEH